MKKTFLLALIAYLMTIFNGIATNVDTLICIKATDYSDNKKFTFSTDLFKVERTCSNNMLNRVPWLVGSNEKINISASSLAQVSYIAKIELIHDAAASNNKFGEFSIVEANITGKIV